MKLDMPEEVCSDQDGTLVSDNVIRIQLREPKNRKWELCTRNCSPGRAFPTIQLFDCEGNLLVETNDNNLSINSSDVDKHLRKRHFKSMGACDYERRECGYPLKKNNTIHGDRIYTRFYKRNNSKSDDSSSKDEWDDSERDAEPNREDHTLKIPQYRRSVSSPLSVQSSIYSDFENSSYKSSDNESSVAQPSFSLAYGKAGTLLLCDDDVVFPNRRRRPIERRNDDHVSISDRISPVSIREYDDNSNNDFPYTASETSFDETITYIPKKVRRKLSKSTSCTKPFEKVDRTVHRTSTQIFPIRKVSQCDNIVRSQSFLDTYLKSLPSRNRSSASWLEELENQVTLRRKTGNKVNEQWRHGMIIDDETAPHVELAVDDSEVKNEIKRRLRKYQRVMSCSDYWTWKRESVSKDSQRRYSEGGCSSSSESFDEADKMLMRLRRRIFQNRKRERKRRPDNIVFADSRQRSNPNQRVVHTNLQGGKEGRRWDAVMGASASRHSRRGLGRRAQSSGDLCNGEPRQPDTCSVAGSAHAGDASTWNSSRSLPSHLDGRRRCPCGECGPSDNNHCGTPTPRHPRHLHHRYNHHYASDLEPVWKLQDPGCDQGYGSERSPEEEFPPSMPVEDDYQEQELDLRQMYPFINDENTFTVRVEKDRRGLGLSVAGGAAVPGGGGGSGLIRIRRLYAAQPAWATGRLRPGDLLLAANGIPLTGLTTYEALEVLRTTPPIVELVVCRPEPEVLECLTPPGGPPEPPLRQPPPDPLNLHPPRVRAPAPPPPVVSDYEEPQPIFDVKFGEFDIVMTKVNGSLGFTLRKEDHSALGHYVRALVREPALSDGRIQPGDRIVAVNDVPMSTLSHGEAVSFLRRCGPVARLRLYRDQCGTPPSPSAASPTTESDTTMITRPKPPLRQEAVNMLCDIAARKLTSDDGNGSHSPCLSPRRFKKLTRNSTGYSQNSDTMHPYSVICPSTTAENSDNELSQTLSYQSTDTADTTYSVVTETRPVRPTCFNGQLFDNIKPPSRPDFLDLGGPPTPINNRKQKLHFSVAAHGYELNNLDNDVLDAPNIYQDMSQNGGSVYLIGNQNLQVNEMSNEPISMPIDLNSSSDTGEARFSHKNPAYQSAVVHPSANNHTNYNNNNVDDINGMKKWKRVTLSPENERKASIDQYNLKEEPEKPKIVHYPDEGKREPGSEPRILTVELNRGWNSRLGFSVQCHPDSGQSFISAIYSDSVAAKDGRLRQGDIILQVNDENITSMTTPQVIDLLRILRGSICITVLRQ